ncbi:MAG: hypothetical protein E7666_06125 [Ruminococcaceae bacterium]|nr:hypothetical protein [Oscillospiraceae bacterium]
MKKAKPLKECFKILRESACAFTRIWMTQEGIFENINPTGTREKEKSPSFRKNPMGGGFFCTAE